MGALGLGQASDEFSVSICAKDSTGPFDYKLRNKIVNLAKKNKIPYIWITQYIPHHPSK